MQIVAVFHSDKLDDQTSPTEVASNPPQSTSGQVKIHNLVPAIKAMGPYMSMAYCSRMARASCAASVLSLALDIDYQSMKELGQFGNLFKDGTVCMYPGHENDDEITWQRDAHKALIIIWAKVKAVSWPILVISHRPIIGALVARARGITDKAGIKSVIMDPTLTKKGYVLFNIEPIVIAGGGMEFDTKIVE